MPDVTLHENTDDPSALPPAGRAVGQAEDYLLSRMGLLDQLYGSLVTLPLRNAVQELAAAGFAAADQIAVGQLRHRDHQAAVDNLTVAAYNLTEQLAGARSVNEELRMALAKRDKQVHDLTQQVEDLTKPVKAKTRRGGGRG